MDFLPFITLHHNLMKLDILDINQDKNSKLIYSFSSQNKIGLQAKIGTSNTKKKKNVSMQKPNGLMLIG